MYRYGDGTPFPLEENFIETLTAAVEACTNAFMPLTELDDRRERARASRAEAERELANLTELEEALATALAPFMAPDRRSMHTQTVAQKTIQTAKTTIQQVRLQVDSRVQALQAQASAGTAADAVLQGLRTFFDSHQLPKTTWVTSWDVRGASPRAEAIATAEKLRATFRVDPEPHQPIRVDQLADGVIVHMMKKGLLGKARPAPVELGKYVLVAFEQDGNGRVCVLRERADRPSPGLRFAVGEHGATWQSLGVSGEPETEENPLDPEDLACIRRLAEGAAKAFRELADRRTLVELTLGNQRLSALPEPRVVPMEVLRQLTPLTRTIRERSRVSGELVLKRDLGGGRREELFVPRAQLAHRFAKLPAEYRQPFEDMGVAGEDTQPAAQIPMRPPAPPAAAPTAPADAATIELKKS